MLKKCSYEGTIFTVLTTLRIMSKLVRMIPEALSILIQVVVYFDRLNTFLLAEELGNNKIARSVKQSSVGDNNAVEIEGGNFTWGSRPPAEMNLVDWFKGMVTSCRSDELVKQINTFF
ncbi:ABC transporter C family member 8-like [Arachis stenosperma]|uniref:ABC transporter C family member 8-like n=1 Tax=Arachis stenosperma TaxID=217475 RepID=UPI0025AD70A9|nr:ABC transporter C family member 8-like [Arachis stenosperma]XP_057721988.1 ABC transporter C family member 8-like [Arachis stenosperma]